MAGENRMLFAKKNAFCIRHTIVTRAGQTRFRTRNGSHKNAKNAPYARKSRVERIGVPSLSVIGRVMLML